MRRDKGRAGFREKAAALFALPEESIGGVPALELVGDRALYLERYQDILSYSQEELCVDGGSWMLRITGQELEIKAMRVGQLRVEGKIFGIALQ